MDTETKPDTSTEGKSGGEGKGKDSPNPDDAPKLTQEQVNAIVTKRLAEQQEKFDKSKKEEDDKRKEKEEKEAGKHKELAEKFEAERDTIKVELETLQTKHAGLSEKLTAIVDADIKALPESLRELAPASLEDRLEWLPKAKQTAAKITGEPIPGNTKGPRPVGSTPQDAVKDAIARKRASGKYAF